MKITSALLFLSLALPASILAQENTTPSSPDSACGSPDVQFDAHASAGQPPSQPEPGKALVYVIEDFKKAPGELGNPTLRIGVDGQWQGAVRPNTYIFFSLDPGEHHLCTSWQSSWEHLSKLASFSHLRADAGKTYYFRARITYAGGGANAASMDLDLQPVDADEGRYLVASDRASDSHPTK